MSVSTDGSPANYVATSASLKGSVTVYLNWVQGAGSSESSTPPKLVVLRISGGTTADAQSLTSQSTVTTKFGEVQGVESVSTETPTRIFRQTYASPWSVNPESGTIVIPLPVPEGQTEVQFTFPVEAKGTTEGIEIPEHSDPRDAPVSRATAHFGAERTDIGVAITSDIETSWKKRTGGVSALPNAYKKRSSTGVLLNEPNEKAVQVAGQNTPSDSSDDIWKIQCLRAADGSMTVESVGVWSHVDQNWRGLGTYTANNVGFTDPRYKWNLTGGTTLPGSYFGSSTGPQTIQGPIMLGNTHYAPSPSTSALQVTVSDANLNLSLSNDYTINWHKPVEDERMLLCEEAGHIEVRSPNEFRDGDVAAMSNSLECKFRLGQPWYLQDFITGFGKAFRGATEALQGDTKKAFIMDKIGELVEDYDLGQPQATNLTFNQDVWDFSKKLQDEWLQGNFVPANSYPEMCFMVYPYMVFVSNVETWDYDVFASHGYVGRESKKLRRPQVTSPMPAGKFQLKQDILSSGGGDG